MNRRDYPEDFKEDVLEMLKEGLFPKHVAKYLGVSRYVVMSIKSPEKSKARMLVAFSLKKGILKRKDCEKCGSNHYGELLHNDYSRPLEIEWLCKKHHMIADQIRLHKS